VGDDRAKSRQGAKSGVMQRIMSIFVTQHGRKGAILGQSKIFKHALSELIKIKRSKQNGVVYFSSIIKERSKIRKGCLKGQKSGFKIVAWSSKADTSILF
jgi:hypothetical protein